MTTKLHTHFTHVFTVYKEGVTTEGPVKIMKETRDNNYNVREKISFYLSLGYTVTPVS